ncbi:endolytic transglycosylase MltG [Ilumatobacter nonamiensis]|uniref:endolytic transglycosylase MltG n=1 Tax=Ilumatobacter nonamiensis TaxID=467093 RepID=UPI00034702A3|nr:endolytic transglycosylase MltG [Ilumatobacter nonamiensis]
MTTELDPLLPEAEVDPDSDPALDWETDPWDNSDRTGSVERLRHQTRVAKWSVYAVMCIAIVMIVIAGAVGWWYVQKLNPEGEPGAVQSFTVAENETFDSLAERLVDDGLISDAGVFEQYVDRNGGLEITPGYYEIRPNDHMGNVLGRLRTPPGQTYSSVTFPEGFTLTQIGRRLEAEIDRTSADDFAEAAADPEVTSTLMPAGGASSLEGLLFPDTYEVSNAESEAQVIDRMIALMERVTNQEDITSKAALLGRTPYEILTIASMIEKEAKVPEDRAKISRVIHNRLGVTTNNPDNPFPLQIDAAVLYGRNQLGLDPNTPFSEVRQIPSDWNTYLLPGLPKTPIASPGRASIEAALNPAPNPAPGDPICVDLPQPDECFYFYYVLADEDGTHAFAATGEQHQANVDRAAAAGLLG